VVLADEFGVEVGRNKDAEGSFAMALRISVHHRDALRLLVFGVFLVVQECTVAGEIDASFLILRMCRRLIGGGGAASNTLISSEAGPGDSENGSQDRVSATIFSLHLMYLSVTHHTPLR